MVICRTEFQTEPSPTILYFNAPLLSTNPRSRKAVRQSPKAPPASQSNAYGMDSPVAPPKFSSRTVGDSSDI